MNDLQEVLSNHLIGLWDISFPCPQKAHQSFVRTPLMHILHKWMEIRIYFIQTIKRRRDHISLRTMHIWSWCISTQVPFGIIYGIPNLSQDNQLSISFSCYQILCWTSMQFFNELWRKCNYKSYAPGNLKKNIFLKRYTKLAVPRRCTAAQDPTPRAYAPTQTRW